MDEDVFDLGLSTSRPGRVLAQDVAPWEPTSSVCPVWQAKGCGRPDSREGNRMSRPNRATVPEFASSRNLTRLRPRAPLEKHAAEVLALVLEGESDSQIAEWFGTSREAVGQFKDRHRNDIAAIRSEVARQVSDFAIASKVARLADYDLMRTKLLARIEADDPLWLEETRHGAKLHMHPLYQELRSVDKQAAEELDQLPRAGITVNNQNVVIVKQVSGSDRVLD